jgi:ADP-heptose:LPS heptosyltransferase
VLALRALGLGDLLTAVPALRGLAAAFPDHPRMLAGPRGLAPVVALLHPVLSDLIDMPGWVAGEGGGPDPALASRLPTDAVAVNLHGRGPESDLLLLDARPSRLIAFAHPDVPETAGGPAWEEDEHEVARWCRLLWAHGLPADPDALDLPHRGLRDPRLTLIHPGAASAARRWPADRWAVVARGERARGRRILVTGSPAERPLAEAVAVAAGLGSEAVAAGTDLGELIDLVASAGRIACGDTGVAHLATALRTPSVILFGPTSPDCWGPPPDRPWHRAIWHGRCGGDPNAPTLDPGLAAIEPAEVLDALARLPEDREFAQA